METVIVKYNTYSEFRILYIRYTYNGVHVINVYDEICLFTYSVSVEKLLDKYLFLSFTNYTQGF